MIAFGGRPRAESTSAPLPHDQERYLERIVASDPLTKLDDVCPDLRHPGRGLRGSGIALSHRFTPVAAAVFRNRTRSG